MREAYSRTGRFASATVAKRFGGWVKALVAAGLHSAYDYSVSRDEYVNDLKHVADTLGTEVLTRSAYKQHGQYSEGAYLPHFPTWVDALKAAGLKVSSSFHIDKLTDNKIPRQPSSF